MRNGLIRFSKAALCVAACFSAAQAAPTLPQVVAGQASFSQQGNVFSITNTPGAIINWQSFSVNAGEVTRFIQQNSDSAVLNRIVGQDPSRILGALQSNGKVFLINPNGIVFGQGARVDVGGLVASTLNLSDADFIAGKKNFRAGENAGSVRNEGAITTPGGGKVFLVAPNVENSGVISAPNGDVVLAAGRSVQLADANNPDLHVIVSAPQDKAVNLGQVVAQGGRIGIYGALVNQRGVVNANSAVLGQDGKIVLKASRDTVLEAGSLTSATGAGKGGEIQLLGQRVGLAGNAAVDASGAAQGGTVLVGGDYQGKNSLLPNAQQTWFGQDASIRADAIKAGNGGKVVLWSDGATSAHGSISVRGAGNGSGGLVETSGHDLALSGIRVDAGAQNGRSGTWLLDPWNVIVRGDGTVPANAVDVFGKPPGDGAAVVSAKTLTDTNANIILQAQNDLTILDAIVTPHSVRAEAGNNLLVDASVTSQGGSLDFRAGKRFTLAGGRLLASPNFIDLKAERMTLAGSIDGVGGTLPALSFSTFDNGTDIVVRGADAIGALSLNPAQLAGFKTWSINLGNSAHTGSVSIDNALSLDGHLMIDTGGAININAPVTLSRADSQFVGTLHPYLGGGVIMVHGPSGKIEAGRKIQLGGGRIVVDGELKSGSIAIDAGADGIEIDGKLEAAGTMTLRSSAGISQSGDGQVKAQALLADGAQVLMIGDNVVGRLAGAASNGNFRFNWSGELEAGLVAGVSGIKAGTEVNLTGGALDVGARLEGAAVLVDAASISGSGVLKGNFVSLASRGGIGSTGTALRTSAQVLSATNTASGSAPININNDRALILQDVVQAGAGNSGAIAIETTGGLTVAETGAERQGVRTGSGDISLVTHSPLTIQGKVRSDSGNIRLFADKGGALTVTPGALVSSGTGSVALTAGSTTIAPGSIVVSSPDKLSVTTTTAPADPVTPTPVPALDACLANRATPGCGPVLEAATQVCIANPDAPQCNQVLPGLAACRANPASMGCAVVLQRAALMECIANPSGPGCAGVLPAYEVCVASPSKLGCVPVLAARAALDACIANPKAPGCASILPSIEVCVASPSTPGCAPVLAARDALNACIANPGAPGCGSILPSIDVCVASPSTLGCVPVLAAREALNACIANPGAPGCGSILPSIDVCVASPSTLGCVPVLAARAALDACIANPKGPGCGAILPTLAQCHANASLPGCVPVLARETFETCVANPSGPGCASVLPALALCKATPGLEGCAQVLQLTFNACLAKPNDAACSGVLPTLSQCVADKTAAGCAVVLPTMAQCIGSPSLQGCSVILPRLEQCAVNPNQQGCEAVLPRPDFCTTHPLDPSCAVFNPGSSGGASQEKTPVGQAQQRVVDLLNTQNPVKPLDSGKPGSTGSSGTAGDKPSDKPEQQEGPAQGPNQEVKNEKPAKKMYCN